MRQPHRVHVEAKQLQGKHCALVACTNEKASVLCLQWGALARQVASCKPTVKDGPTHIAVHNVALYGEDARLQGRLCHSRSASSLRHCTAAANQAERRGCGLQQCLAVAKDATPHSQRSLRMALQ